MNPRIRELAEQADEYAANYEFEHGGDEFDIFKEKFAELIVLECVSTIEQRRSSGENRDSWTITRDMAFFEMQQELKKQFGLK